MRNRRKLSFLGGLAIYTGILLALGTAGLGWLWGFLDAYERSRPQYALAEYLETLTTADLCGRVLDSLTERDEALQSREECLACLNERLSGAVQYRKRTRESEAARQVYTLRCGGQSLGTLTLEAQAAGRFGFAPWRVSELELDAGGLLTPGGRIQAPEGIAVRAGETLLDEAYVTAREAVDYPLFREFYGDYELPRLTVLTYETAPTLGEVPLSLRDGNGNPFVYDEETDINALLPACTEGEREELDAFLAQYLKYYASFSGSANNMDRLLRLIVPDSKLSRRMLAARDGLRYAQSKGDTIRDIAVHHYVPLEDGRYLCDVTYLVDTKGHQGVVRTENNVKLLIQRTSGGLRAETMVSY